MKDFFDEDFPLTQKQENELNKLNAEARAVQEDIPEEPVTIETTVSEVNSYDRSDFFSDDEETVIFEGESNCTEPEPVCEETADTMVYEQTEEVTEDIQAEIPVQEPVPEPITEPIPTEDETEYIPEDNITVSDNVLAEETEEEDDLSVELKTLNEKLASIERTVNAITAESDDEQTDSEDIEPFTYSYDERYFAEDETPAYKHPEIVKAHKASKNSANRISKDDITLNVKTLAKVGAAVAGAIVALKLLSDDSKK